MRYLPLLLLILLFSCSTEEDKYPDMAVFSPDMEGKFTFKEIEPVPTYYRDTDKYVFFLTNNSIADARVLIYNKASKKLIKTLALPNNQIRIDTSGSIYGYDEKQGKTFKYVSPAFKLTYLETVSLEYVSDANMEKKYASEIKNQQLKGDALYDFLEDKRYEILEEDVINGLRCITELDKSNTAIAHYKNKEIYLEQSNYLYRGTIIKSKLNGVTDCMPSNYELDKKSYFSASPLDQFDYVTLDYNFKGSNHYVMSVNSENLYYYELKLNKQSTKFKFPLVINNVVNLEDKVIFEVANKYYEVSVME
ncbi:hypothetical protein [Fulvivirga ligni]|uniref:hypothetical protein n=1 Tax=Fulvivirga ligni TaxID=2904246 RepID=UPI001F2C8F39|nr:hypothetical protein [Fulvivirga ligni]UII19320.1 hypothetical protein LVD16_15860 [Fulvivirga ligni]